MPIAGERSVHWPMAGIEEHIRRLTGEMIDAGTEGIVLTGSHARDEAGPFSDLDFDVFAETAPEHLAGPQLFYSGAYLVSVVTTTVAAMRAAFRDPAEAIFAVPGMRNAPVLYDRDGSIARLKGEAESFRWAPLQTDADRYAARRLVKNAEGVHKLLGTLVAGEDGGVAYTMAWLIRSATDAVAVHLGLMIPSVNAYFRIAGEAMGEGSAWTRAHRRALGIGEALPLRERAGAALALYVETARALDPILSGEQRDVVERAVAVIRSTGWLPAE
jgi:predicted nucleotidyltransferase